jgi:hypothetical protein
MPCPELGMSEWLNMSLLSDLFFQTFHRVRFARQCTLLFRLVVPFALHRTPALLNELAMSVGHAIVVAGTLVLLLSLHLRL